MPLLSGPTQRKFAALVMATLSAFISAPWQADAQTYPDRTITLVVPFAAGGGADATGRIIAEAMAQHLNQSIVVENVAGASGAIGHGRVKNAAPDVTRSALAAWEHWLHRLPSIRN